MTITRPRHISPSPVCVKNRKHVYLKLIYNRSLRAAAERIFLYNVLMNSWSKSICK